jgi:hypothetical protein
MSPIHQPTCHCHCHINQPVTVTVTSTCDYHCHINCHIINLSLMINQSCQPITVLSLSLIYHHQPTVTRSTHMDTKTITKPCTSTINHVTMYHTMYINHVHQPVPYHASTMYHTMYIPCTSTMYLIHVPRICLTPCTKDVPQTCTNASTRYQRHDHQQVTKMYLKPCASSMCQHP